MADLTLVAADVVADFNATIKTGVAGEALSAGDVVYADSTDSDELKMAKHDGTAAQALVVGIVLADALDTATVSYISSGELALGGVLTKGIIYVLSANFGKIAVVADPGTGDYVTVVGVAKSAATLEVKFIVSGATLA